MMKTQASGPSPPRPDPDDGTSCWDTEAVVTADVRVLRKACRRRGGHPRDPGCPRGEEPGTHTGAPHGTGLRLSISEENNNELETQQLNLSKCMWESVTVSPEAPRPIVGGRADVRTPSTRAVQHRGGKGDEGGKEASEGISTTLCPN